VAHPCHEFPGIRARIGGELVAGMAQAVNVKAAPLRGTAGPASAAGSALAARPPHAGPHTCRAA